jgi:SAM-dependent methyltransferase
MAKSLLDDNGLEKSEVVANAVMNRQRGLSGGNSYAKELGFNPIEFLRRRLSVQKEAAWVDLCCGTGRALIQAAQACQENGLQSGVTLVGVDLIPMFDQIPSGLNILSLQQSSVTRWQAPQQFDLITCVHGLHYIGDKLGVIHKASRWLRKGGLFAAHLDYTNLRLRELTSARIRIGRDLHKAGFNYDSRRHLLTCYCPTERPLPYRYLGADDLAGPNCTGQPSVDSHYEELAR